MAARTHKPTNITRTRTVDQRKSAAKRGYNMDWRARRLMHLRRNPSCVRCGEPADVADHIERHEGDRDKFYGNLQSMCSSCHGIKTRIETRPGYTYKPNVVVVCGEPDATKLFIAKQRPSNDLVVDAASMSKAELERIVNQIAAAHPALSAWVAMPDRQQAFDASVRMGGRLWVIGESEAGDMGSNR